MKKKGQLMGGIMTAVIAIIFLGVIWGIQSSATNYEEAIESQAITVVPVNISLAQDKPIALVNIVNSTGTTIDSSNYTDAVSSGYIEMLDNSSWGGGTATVTYQYQHVGYISSAIARLVVGFITVLLAVGIIVFLMNKGRE